MKTKAIASLFWIIVSGCQPNQAEKLYDAAYQMEQQSGGSSYTTVEAYRQVIRTDPKSLSAEKAQKRIDVIQQQIATRNAAFDARRSRRDE